MKKIILFSPTGYVGTFLKESLQANQDVELFEITRSSKPDEYHDDYDIMIYSAAVSSAGASVLIKDNALTAISTVDFCHKHNVKRIIYLSTDSIYGELNTEEASESTIMVNPGLYGTSKYLAEKIIIESGIPYYIIRMPGIVGRVWRDTYFCRLIDQACAHEPITVYNAEKNFNNVLDVDDLIQFIMLLCSCERTQDEIFLLGNTKKVELIKIVNYIKELCRSDSEIKVMSGEGKRYFTLNVNRAVAYGYTSKSMWSIIDGLYDIKKTLD